MNERIRKTRRVRVVNAPLSAEALLALTDRERRSVQAFYLWLAEELAHWRTQTRAA